MTAWLRRQGAPENPLTEDRKRLVQSYMDAAEEQTRREVVEERDRQMREREQARRLAAVPDTSAAAVEQAREQARREAAEELALQVAAAEQRARQATDEDARRRMAAAVEEAREQARREFLDEMARQVAAAKEQARREAAEAAAWHIPAADVTTRRESAEAPAQLKPSAVEREPVAFEEAPPPIVAVEERDTSGERLPLHKWVQGATQPNDEDADADWPRALLNKRLSTPSE